MEAQKPVGRLKCPLCGSPDMVVEPRSTYVAVLSCNTCENAFEIPIGTHSATTTEKRAPEPQEAQEQESPSESQAESPDAEEELEEAFDDGLADLGDLDEDDEDEDFDDLLDAAEADADAEDLSDDDAPEDGSGASVAPPAGDPLTDPDDLSDDDAPEEADGTADGAAVSEGDGTGGQGEAGEAGEAGQTEAGDGDAGQGSGGVTNPSVAAPEEDEADDEDGFDGFDDEDDDDRGVYNPDMDEVIRNSVENYTGNVGDATRGKAERELLDPAKGLQREQVSDQRVSTFYRKIGDVMVDNKFDRLVGGKRSGKIVAGALHRVAAGASRIFAKPEERKNKHYNVVFVVDGSGSMNYPVYTQVPDAKAYGGVRAVEIPAPEHHWSKSDWRYVEEETRGGGKQTYFPPMTRTGMAADVVGLMVAGLDRHSIDFAVVVFGDRAKVLKDFSTKTPDLKQLEGRIAQSCFDQTNNGSTAAFSGLKAAEELLKGRDGHNIIIFLTDGGPCDSGFWKDPRSGKEYSSGWGIPAELYHDRNKWKAYDAKMRHTLFLQEYGKELERIADVITVGIQTDTIEAWAPNSHVIQDRDDFMRVVLGEFSRFIKRG